MIVSCQRRSSRAHPRATQCPPTQAEGTPNPVRLIPVQEDFHWNHRHQPSDIIQETIQILVGHIQSSISVQPPPPRMVVMHKSTSSRPPHSRSRFMPATSSIPSQPEQAEPTRALQFPFSNDTGIVYVLPDHIYILLSVLDFPHSPRGLGPSWPPSGIPSGFVCTRPRCS